MGKLPTFRPVPAQPAQQQSPLPAFGFGASSAPPGWLHVSRYVVNPASIDTSSRGDILLPSGYNHALVLWLAKDTSASTIGSFGGLQLACQGGAIDTGAHYNWGGMFAGLGVAPGNHGTLGDSAWTAFEPAGGGAAANNWNRGSILIPFYSSTGINPTAIWDYAVANPSATVRSADAGEFFGATGPVTKLHFFARAGGGVNLAAGTTFDLFVSV